MARESGLRQRLAEYLRGHGYWVQAVESGDTAPGIPDTYYRLNKHVVGWLELKKIKEWPKKNTTSFFKSLNHPLSDEQAVWIYNELKRGGRADILVAYERRYFFVPGTMADVFNDLTPETILQYEIKKDDINPILQDPLYYSREL